MKQKNIKIIISAIIALIILAGIVVVNIWGFNKELQYEKGQSIEIYLEEKADIAKIKDIVNNELGTKNKVQTVEIYEDMVIIKAQSISEEQKNNIVNKIKENYQFEQTAEKTNIKTEPETRIRDMYKKYVIPFIISGGLIVIYMGIRYHKKDTLKVIITTIAIPVVAELVLLSVIAITRIPVGRITPVFVILTYIASIMHVINEIEK